MIEHLPNWMTVVREAARILRQGGYLILTTPNMLRLHSRLRYFLTGTHKLIRRRVGWDLKPDDLYAYHINPVDFPLLHTVLHQEGLSVQSLGFTRFKPQHAWLLRALPAHCHRLLARVPQGARERHAAIRRARSEALDAESRDAGERATDAGGAQIVSDMTVRLLFVPVSGPKGMGEYGRALAMAGAAAARWPNAAIHFALSREAPYANTVPFPATLLPASPTFHSGAVAALIEEFRPGVVIFDNAGRTAQLRAARAAGARVVFVSARASRRRKAFRLRWMRLIDEHWIAYPRILAGAPGSLERAKLRLLGRPVLRFLNPILPEADAKTAESLLAQLGLTRGGYVAVVPGGGTEHPGMANAMSAIAEGSRRIAARGIDTVLVGMRSEVPDASLAPGAANACSGALGVAAPCTGCRCQWRVHAAAGTRLRSTVHRCARWRATRRQRIDRCVSAGIALRGEPNAAILERDVSALLADAAQLEALREMRVRFDLGNGARAVVDALGALSGR